MAAYFHTSLPTDLSLDFTLDGPGGPSRALARGQYWFACLLVAALAGVLVVGLGYEFAAGAYPCPLSVLQRAFLALALLGAAYIVRQGLEGRIGRRDFMMGWGMALVACVGGSVASWRQTMLHILPGDPGYGGEVWGLHLYVWALLVFQGAIVVIGVVLATSHRTAERTIPISGAGMLAGWLALGCAALAIWGNAVETFLLEGFHWSLPENPARYQLLHDLGILG
jgi:disulfide bond formation protein DsbB